ncbi:MAG: RadC family protein [Candidatus Dormibacteria bacterium]
MGVAWGTSPVGEDCDLSLAGIVAELIDFDEPGGCAALVRGALACGMSAWIGEEGKERAIAAGFTARQARQLRLCAEFATRLDKESWAMPAPITGPADVLAQVTDLRSSAQERVVAIYLDSRNRPIHRELVAVGGLRASVIQPRDILAPALRLPAAGIVLVHNHPSGDTTPSREDVEVTKQLVAAARLLGLELLDHLVVSSTRCSSLRELGHL